VEWKEIQRSGVEGDTEEWSRKRYRVEEGSRKRYRVEEGSRRRYRGVE